MRVLSPRHLRRRYQRFLETGREWRTTSYLPEGIPTMRDLLEAVQCSNSRQQSQLFTIERRDPRDQFLNKLKAAMLDASAQD